jgi:asparagine synthase (glutamine-hydrolysing)
MCGVLGWIDPALTDRDTASRMAAAALSALRNRGPDDQRIEWGPGWVLGHTRLAIIDLSQRSSQPMTDGQGLWLVYNGEIYNFRALRAELEAKGHRFVSEGDAEVLLHAFKQWGVACLERLRGMFAFAIVDVARQEIVLARDRYGVKPLAYEIQGDGIRFASDLRALRSLPNASRDIDAESAYLFLTLGYIPAPHTIHRGVRKVKPGHYVRARWFSKGVSHVEERAYWSIGALHHDVAHHAMDGDLLPEFERRVADAVGSRLISDGPVGTLLSGGIDSALVTSFGRELSGGSMASFTMGFDDPAYDEAPVARAVADILGCSHHEFRMSRSGVGDVFARMWAAYDEPFADSSAVPTLELSRQVASSVKVALTGDGGDETGCGYDWHRSLNRLDPAGDPRGFSDTRDERMTRFRKRHRIQRDRAIDRPELWGVLRTGLSDEMLDMLPLSEPGTHAPLSEYFREWSRDLNEVGDCYTWAGCMDLLTYVPDDLMVKSDRASMSVGLELREPLLDHDLTMWLLSIPVSARFDSDSNTTKVLPRRALSSRIPPDIFDRPKQGFTPPVATWLAGPLGEQMDDALARLSDGRLEPIALPRGCASWLEADPVLRDVNNEFLWRILCFSEWNRHANGR